MDHRISRILANLHNQKVSLVDNIRESFISDGQVKYLIEDYWIPTERLYKTVDRIRSSSIDETETTLPNPPEENSQEDLTEQIGISPTELIKHVKILFELLPELTSEIKEIEVELKDADAVIEKYNNIMEKFMKNINDFHNDLHLSLSGNDMFLESVNHNIYSYLHDKHIKDKMKRYQYLLVKIKYIRTLVHMVNKSVQFADEDGETNNPICKICLDRCVRYVFVPCGHTCCQECGMKTLQTNTKCSFCRTDVSNMIKIFF